jgi:hypothetical protein
MTIRRRRPFTNLWYKVYSHIVRQGHYLSGLPFSITNESCSLSIPPGSDTHFKSYMAWFTFYNLIYVLNYIYILLWGTEHDFKNHTFCIVHTFFHLVVWCMMLTALVKSHQMSLVINNIIDFMGRFNGMSYFIAIHFPKKFILCIHNHLSARWRPKFYPNMEKRHRYLSRIAATFVPISILIPTITTIHFILYPGSNIYVLLKWMPVWLRNYPLTITLYGCLWLWMQMAFWTAIIFYVVLVWSYFTVTFPLVCNELVRGRRSYNTNTRLRSANNVVLEYRKLEVLHLNVMDIVGWAILPEQALIADAIMFCNYALIRIGHQLDAVTITVLIIYGMVLTIVWVTILEFAGSFHKRANTLITSFKYGHGPNKKNRLLMDKFRKSCRPLGFRSGGGFCIKRLTGLQFMQGIVVGTMRVALTT